ncbi:MAG: helix-turn-helix transcriptional regulator [Erysipelotrichaceae bacterium]|nr:helix-turn-helix transcriptional regulator [Erysipelotrichaceae bacterium]
MTFAQWLKDKRKEYGMTQEELADKLNIVRQTVSLYENGKRIPDNEGLKAIAGVFSVSVEEIRETITANMVNNEKPVKNMKGYICLLSIFVCGLFIFVHVTSLKMINDHIWIDNTDTIMRRLILSTILPVLFGAEGILMGKGVKIMGFNTSFVSSKRVKSIVSMCWNIFIILILVSYTGFLNSVLLKSAYLTWCTSLTYPLFVSFRYISYLVISAVGFIRVLIQM